jgi:hypothetical protein
VLVVGYRWWRTSAETIVIIHCLCLRLEQKTRIGCRPLRFTLQMALPQKSKTDLLIHTAARLSVAKSRARHKTNKIGTAIDTTRLLFWVMDISVAS